MEKKQTAVEYLVEQLIKQGFFKRLPVIEIQQAKQMEKEQISNAYMNSTAQFANDARIDYPKSAEQYYNETFGGQYNHIVDTTEMICEDVNCKHCAEDIAQMQDDDLTDDEWLIKEKHKHILNFAVWFKESDWDCYDNTDRGNLYANPLVTDSLLTIEEIYELFLKKEL